MIDLKQKELLAWQLNNFGLTPQRSMEMALGMAEEVGEVCHHVLKGVQKIRGGVEGIDKEQVADGVADTLIYGIQLLSSLDIDAETVIAQVIEDILARDWKKCPEGINKSIQYDICPVCGEIVFSTPSGKVCKNGHGGAL